MLPDTLNSLSTSSKNISADVKLAIYEKLQWLYECHKNNQKPLQDVDPRIEFIDFKTKFPEAFPLSADWGIPPVSPSRFLCDSFWSELDLSLLYKKRPIKVLEVGCGSGIYGLKLRQKLGKNLALYRGVDIVEHQIWEERKAHNPFEFFVDRAESIQKYLPEIDLIFTQSAIEHFEHDLIFFRYLAEYVCKTEQTIWQIHLMPSAECLETYLWHGYRQYTPRTLSMITRLFPAGAEFAVYRLGGLKANRIHKRYITLPNLLFGADLREKNPQKYINAATAAIEADQKNKFRVDASFYALVIKSNCKN